MDNATFQVIRQRQAVRSFSPREVAEETIRELIELSNRAPSAYNIQPWHFIVVRDIELRRLLHELTLKQIQVLEAPVSVVFIADPNCWKESYERVLNLGVASNALSKEQADFCRKSVQFIFEIAPYGLFGFIKKLIHPFLRFKQPLPDLLYSYADICRYVKAQTNFAAANFMLAARAAGLDTCPMESFDEYRVKKLLKIPPQMTVALIISLGYRSEDKNELPQSVRLPLAEKLYFEQFGRN